MLILANEVEIPVPSETIFHSLMYLSELEYQRDISVTVFSPSSPAH